MDEDSQIASLLGTTPHNPLMSTILTQYSPNTKRKSISKIQQLNINQIDVNTLKLIMDQVSEEGPGGPFDYDVLISDISHADLVQVSLSLGFPQYFNMTSAHLSFPVDGVFRGQNRVFVMASIQPIRKINGVKTLMNAICAVPMIVDIGSPWTFLMGTTMDLLFTPGFRQGDVLMYGTCVTVYSSHKQFSSVNIIGQDALVALRAVLTVDYVDRGASIVRKA